MRHGAMLPLHCLLSKQTEQWMKARDRRHEPHQHQQNLMQAPHRHQTMMGPKENQHIQNSKPFPTKGGDGNPYTFFGRKYLDQTHRPFSAHIPYPLSVLSTGKISGLTNRYIGHAFHCLVRRSDEQSMTHVKYMKNMKRKRNGERDGKNLPQDIYTQTAYQKATSQK